MSRYTNSLEWYFSFVLTFLIVKYPHSWLIPNAVCLSHWPRGQERRSAATRMLSSWVRNPPGALMFICCECCVLSGRGLCDELITLPEEFYRLWCVVVCDLETSWMKRPWPTWGCRAKQTTQRVLLLKLVPISRDVSASFHCLYTASTLTTPGNRKNYSSWTILYRLITPFRIFTGMYFSCLSLDNSSHLTDSKNRVQENKVSEKSVNKSFKVVVYSTICSTHDIRY